MKDRKLYLIIAIADVIAAALIIWHLQLIKYAPNAYAGYYEIRDVYRLVIITLGLFVGIEEKYINKGPKSTMYLFVIAAAVNGIYLLNLFDHRGLKAFSDVLAGLSMDNIVEGTDMLFLLTFFVPLVIAVTCGIIAVIRAFRLNKELKEEGYEASEK